MLKRREGSWLNHCYCASGVLSSSMLSSSLSSQSLSSLNGLSSPMQQPLRWVSLVRTVGHDDPHLLWERFPQFHHDPHFWWEPHPEGDWHFWWRCPFCEQPLGFSFHLPVAETGFPASVIWDWVLLTHREHFWGREDRVTLEWWWMACHAVCLMSEQGRAGGS